MASLYQTAEYQTAEKRRPECAIGRAIHDELDPAQEGAGKRSVIVRLSATNGRNIGDENVVCVVGPSLARGRASPRRRSMVFRAIRVSSVALICQVLMAVPAGAAMIGWEYSGAVSSNVTHYGGVNVGDPVVMTVLVDTDAPDVYSGGAGPNLEPCGLYSVPLVTISFGGLVFQSSPTMTVNTPAGASNCGYGPSQDGYVLGGGATGPSPGPLPWRFYAEIRDVPLNDGIPTAPPLGSGVFLDLAYGFFPPSYAEFAMTANLRSAGSVSAPTAIPEPGTMGLALAGLAAFGMRRAARRRQAAAEAGNGQSVDRFTSHP